jgi:hypothetical protein
LWERVLQGVYGDSGYGCSRCEMQAIFLKAFGGVVVEMIVVQVQ